MIVISEDSRSDAIKGYFLRIVFLLGILVLVIGCGGLHGKTETKSQDAQTYYARGFALAQQGDVEGAITEYHNAIRTDPNYADAHNGLGAVLIQKGLLDGAMAEF